MVKTAEGAPWCAMEPWQRCVAGFGHQKDVAQRLFLCLKHFTALCILYRERSTTNRGLRSRLSTGMEQVVFCWKIHKIMSVEQLNPNLLRCRLLILNSYFFPEFWGFAICRGISNIIGHHWTTVGFSKWVATIAAHGHLGNVPESKSTNERRSHVFGREVDNE